MADPENRPRARNPRHPLINILEYNWLQINQTHPPLGENVRTPPGNCGDPSPTGALPITFLTGGLPSRYRLTIQNHPHPYRPKYPPSKSCFSPMDSETSPCLFGSLSRNTSSPAAFYHPKTPLERKQQHYPGGRLKSSTSLSRSKSSVEFISRLTRPAAPDVFSETPIFSPLFTPKTPSNRPAAWTIEKLEPDHSTSRSPSTVIILLSRP